MTTLNTAWDQYGTHGEGGHGEGTPWADRVLSVRSGGVLLPQSPITGSHPGLLDYRADILRFPGMMDSIIQQGAGSTTLQ